MFFVNLLCDTDGHGHEPAVDAQLGHQHSCLRYHLEGGSANELECSPGCQPSCSCLVVPLEISGETGALNDPGFRRTATMIVQEAPLADEQIHRVDVNCQ
jgi:hypothetical protein